MESRLTVLGSVADALLPPLPEAAATARAMGDPATAAMLDVAGASPEQLLKVLKVMEMQLTPQSRGNLNLLLRMLNSRFGSMLLLGRDCIASGLPRAFVDLPRERRAAVLRGWATSTRRQLRLAFKGLKSMTMAVVFTDLTPDGRSTILEAMRYSITDPERPLKALDSALAAEAAVAAALIDLSSADGTDGGTAAAAAALSAKGLPIRFPDAVRQQAIRAARPAFVIRADAVVVGSGAGGGVTAARLAEAGLKVIVLEKASFVPAANMTQQEGQCFETMYERGGFLASEDGTVAVLAGATVGGGTRVNWCASFRTPPHVRREWAEDHKLSAFASAEYDAAQDAVWERLGVRTGFDHPKLSSTLRDSMDAVGAHSADVARNCSEAHCGGHCCFGCARGAKADMVNTFLADACIKGDARIISGVYAERVITDTNSRASEGHQRSRRAVGVLCTAGHPSAPLRFAVQAPVVISSCGSIHTPALLLRSGIKCRGNVGANLRLHPCTVVVGVFPQATATEAEQAPSPAVGVGESRRLDMTPGGSGGGSIRPWEGTIMSIFSNEVAHWENSGYGALLYTPAVHPGIFASAAPWLGGEDYKRLMLQYPNACIVLVLTRDQDPGYVAIDRDGRPRINYSLSKRDEGSMLQGVELALRSMAAAGADMVMTIDASPTGRFNFADTGATASPQQRGASPAFKEYLASVAQTGVVPLQTGLFCAHQMGTARLGVDPYTSAQDPSGECWDVAGLHCLDGSAFPTPTGVNPMITIESISYMLAGPIGARAAAVLKKKKRRSGVQLEYEESGAGATAKL